MRGFVIENEIEESDLKSKIRQEMIEKLAAEWNAENRKAEKYQFRCDEEIDEEADYLACMAENVIDSAVGKALHENPNLSKEEIQAISDKAVEDYNREYYEKANEALTRMDVIEELLGELGARMMRPYEHWNEDERYMEYMENRYSDDY